MSSCRAIAIVLVLAACSSRREPAPTPAPPQAGSSAPVTPAAPAPITASDATIREHMRAHFAAISELQRAIVRGRLDEARREAQWLVDHDEGMLAEWKPRVDEMRTAAREVVAAPDLPTAAVLAAGLGRACSRCHQERTATIAFAWSIPPPEAPDLATQMQRHQWAAARLWEGLVGPSDEMWNQGAAVLAETQLDTVAAGGSGRGDVPALAARVRELAKRAAAEADLDGRARLYGELLSTCAGCHALVRPTPAP